MSSYRHQLFPLAVLYLLVGFVLGSRAHGQAPLTPRAPSAKTGALPGWLPYYDLTLHLDVANHVAHGTLLATWTNPHSVPTNTLVFNAHSRYIVADKDVGLMAKTLEILRLDPSDALGAKQPALDITRIRLVDHLRKPGRGQTPALLAPGAALNFRYEGDTLTTLVVPLPMAVKGGESVTLALEFTFHLPPKQGRWGQWDGVTYLATWLPVFAFYGPEPHGPPGKRPITWQPTPFIAWHQPFFNEAGHYHVRIVLPEEEKIACSGTIVSQKPVGEGKKEVEIQAIGVRDFAFLCSTCYAEFETEVTPLPGKAPIRIHVRAFPEHEHYARAMLRIAAEAITAYSRWFGPYPYRDFTIAESYFGWNGNECGTLVMIDARIFAMPHLAHSYVDYLVSHEICHQWWYNLVGTNGYCETWMDESLATYFSHRLLNEKVGHNNSMLVYPRGLEWLPNIHREDYRSAGLYSAFGRGANSKIVQALPQFQHIANMFSMAYDKGSRVVGMIEYRLGQVAFLDFMRIIYRRYRYRILRVDDFQRELEAYTGQSWEVFFQRWLHGDGLSDWAIARVKLDQKLPDLIAPRHEARPTRVTVLVEQRAEYDERTVLGFAFKGQEGFPIRVPILPQAESYTLDDPPATITIVPREGGWLGKRTQKGARVRVEVELPDKPVQVMVDPDQVLVDREPANNFWKKPIRWRFTPVYTFLEHTDLTNSYDRWNVIAGPWFYSTFYDSAWYTRSTMAGFRVGVYRTQEFQGGIYTGYRTDYHDILAGADGVLDHWPGPDFQLGFNVEQRLTALAGGDDDARRGVLWGRYIFLRTSSLILEPSHFIEGFASHQDNFLPFPYNRTGGGVRFDELSTLGLHYRVDYLTPYWDPEGGFRFDITYEGGIANLPEQVGLNKISSQLTYVHYLPDFSGWLDHAPQLQEKLEPGFRWLADTRLAVRLYGATSTPARGEFFTMGGSQLFRAFDLAQRQGSTVWVATVEWRIPLATHLKHDVADHLVGLRNLYGALFYDVGDAYVRGHSLGPVAHGVGVGLRADVAWFSFLERTVFRLDIARAVNVDTGLQVWVGVQHPF
jgi:hypothetical protein